MAENSTVSELIEKFHASDFIAVIEKLSSVPADDLSAEEKYFLGVSLIRTQQDFARAIDLLDRAEADGHSSQWLQFWRCHGYIATKQYGAALEGACQLLREDIFFRPAAQMLVNLLLRMQQNPQQAPNGQTLIAAFLPAFQSLLGAIDAGAGSPNRGTVASETEQNLLLDLLVHAAAARPTQEGYVVETDHPVAAYSDDAIAPRGAASDNSRSPRFVAACERQKPGRLSHMDLGCAGGGLVHDFITRGHTSVGLEGSDFALKEQLGFWRVIPNNLRTCDITKPFIVKSANGTNAHFDFITAWEVLEHIDEALLPCLLGNIRDHLKDDGHFVASVAQFPDYDAATGHRWHVTLRSRDWWFDCVRAHGLEPLSTHAFETDDFVRGVGRKGDWDVKLNPMRGFHLVARKVR